MLFFFFKEFDYVGCYEYFVHFNFIVLFIVFYLYYINLGVVSFRFIIYHFSNIASCIRMEIGYAELGFVRPEPGLSIFLKA